MDKKCKLVPGQVVRAIAGRDRGNIFLVFEVLDAKHVLIVDGKSRRLERPKKKRIIHLQAFNVFMEDFETVKKSRTFNNAHIKKYLSAYEMNEEDC